MTDLFATFDLPTLKATCNAISSPASASGRTRYARQGGQIADLFGLEAAHASRSAGQTQTPLESLTTAICGRIGGVSSKSVDLTRSLASKLIARQQGCGSTLYRQTWKVEATPAGRSYSILRASAPQTSATADSGLPTPTVKGKSGGATIDPQKVLARALGGHANDLQDFVQLVTGWATPSARDWRTPNHKAFAERGGAKKGEQLNNQVAHTIPGASLNGSTASTGRSGLLNPAFTLWLQGIPATWASSAVLVTP